jgi:hypothetical protein
VAHLNKEKKDLATMNSEISHAFSTLEAFVFQVLGPEAIKEVRDEENNYDLDKMKSKFYDSNSDVQTLKENNDMLMAKIERSALQEEQYRQLKKKVEDWGGEGYIASSMSKIKTLKLENESKDTKIKELNDRLSTLNENKGAELLSALNSAGEDSDGKTKGALMLEVSQKSNEILELKEKLNQALESLKMTKQGNPFDRAGGSDDEDNKERIVTRNSIDNRVNI